MRTHSYSQTHNLIFLVTLFIFIKLALIKYTPLINDEAYTLTISRYFSLSYFDHPPLMTWISYLFHLFEVQEAYSFRIPHIIFGTLTSLFLFKIGSQIYSRQTGVFAAILYFISPFFFFSGGFFVVPDSLLNFSVAGATFFAIKIIFGNENKKYSWFALGLLLAIAFLSKYQSYLFALALFITFIIWKKEAFLNPNFYISFIISVCGLLPVIIWNIENNFDSFNFHQARSYLQYFSCHQFYIFTVSASSTNNIYFNLYKFSKLFKSKKKRRKFSNFSLFANNTYIQLFYDGFRKQLCSLVYDGLDATYSNGF